MVPVWVERPITSILAPGRPDGRDGGRGTPATRGALREAEKLRLGPSPTDQCRVMGGRATFGIFYEHQLLGD